MVSQGATKDEVREKLDQLRNEINNTRRDVSDVSERLDAVGKDIMTKIDEVSKADQEKQKAGYMRIIGLQSAILLPIIAAVIAFIVQTFFTPLKDFLL